MSRTDKDRPDWVKRFDDTLVSHVEHDHRHGGPCVEETLGDARYDATRRLGHNTHRRDPLCPAWRRVEYHCGGSRVRVPVDWYAYSHFECGLGRSYGCDNGVHTRIERTGEHCPACAEADHNRTLCQRTLSGNLPYWRRYRPRDGSEMINARFERPNRRRVRDDLHSAARDYNTHRDTGIDPVPPITRGAARLFS